MNEQKNGQTDKWKDTDISTDRQCNYYKSLLKGKRIQICIQKTREKKKKQNAFPSLKLFYNINLEGWYINPS